MDTAQAVERIDSVGVHPGLARSLLRYFGESYRDERGGVLLGQRRNHSSCIAAAVFPPQLARARDHCAFDVAGIDVVRKAVTELLDGDLRQRTGTIVGWVHSHPGHGLFLSASDATTLLSWVQLDQNTVAVVADPYLRVPPQGRIA